MLYVLTFSECVLGSDWRGKVLLSISVSPVPLQQLPHPSTPPRALAPLKGGGGGDGAGVAALQMYLLQAVGLPSSPQVHTVHMAHMVLIVHMATWPHTHGHMATCYAC